MQILPITILKEFTGKGEKVMTYVCFDIGGTSTKYALIQQDGWILSRGSTPTIHTSTEEFVDFLVKKVTSYEKLTTIEGIGVSIPGIVEKRTGKTIMAGAIRHLYGKNIKNLLSDYFPYPIHVENDARCALMAEMTMGSARGLDDVVLMTIGTGIGGAVAYDGNILYGKSYKAGEFGMMRLDVANQPETTMHELASTLALINKYKKVKSISPNILLDAQTIFNAMEKDEETAEVVDEWISYLAAGLFNVAAFFNPEKILIGGGVSANPKLLPMIYEKLKENPHWTDYEADIEIAKFKNDAGVIGALSFLLKNLDQQRVS